MYSPTQSQAVLNLISAPLDPTEGPLSEHERIRLMEVQEFLVIQLESSHYKSLTNNTINALMIAVVGLYVGYVFEYTIFIFIAYYALWRGGQTTLEMFGYWKKMPILYSVARVFKHAAKYPSTDGRKRDACRRILKVINILELEK